MANFRRPRDDELPDAGGIFRELLPLMWYMVPPCAAVSRRPCQLSHGSPLVEVLGRQDSGLDAGAGGISVVRNNVAVRARPRKARSAPLGDTHNATVLPSVGRQPRESSTDGSWAGSAVIFWFVI